MIVVIIILTIFAGFFSAYRELSRIKTEPESKHKIFEWKTALKQYKARAFWESLYYLFVINCMLFYYLEKNNTFRINDLLYPIFIASIFWLIKDVLIAVNLGKKFYYTSFQSKLETDFYLFFVKIFAIFGSGIIIIF